MHAYVWESVCECAHKHTYTCVLCVSVVHYSARACRVNACVQILMHQYSYANIHDFVPALTPKSCVLALDGAHSVCGLLFGLCLCKHEIYIKSLVPVCKKHKHTPETCQTTKLARACTLSCLHAPNSTPAWNSCAANASLSSCQRKKNYDFYSFLLLFSFRIYV